VNEGAPNRYRGLPFNGDIQIRDVMQDKVHERFVLVFANVLDEGLRWELFPEFVSGQPVLCKCVIESIDDCEEEGDEVGLETGSVRVKADLDCHRRPVVQRSLRNLSLLRTRW
jgi:hypothetical protein